MLVSLEVFIVTVGFFLLPSSACSFNISIFSNLFIFFQSSALSASVFILCCFSVFHLSVFWSMYSEIHLVMSHLSSNFFFFSILSFFSIFFLSISSCLSLLSARSFFLFSSKASSAFIFSSTSLFILSSVSSIFASHFTWFVECFDSVSFFFSSGSFLHFFQMFSFTSLRSISLFFSSSFKRFLCSCSGSFFQVSVIFFCVSLFSFHSVACCLALFCCSFLCLSVFLASSSLFQVFSFFFR